MWTECVYIGTLLCDTVSSNESSNMINVIRRLRQLDQCVIEARWRVLSASNGPGSVPVLGMLATLVSGTH